MKLSPEMQKILQIDIWDDTGCLFECISQIKEGCKKMRFLKKTGKESLRMYVRDSNGDTSLNRIYFFQKNKLIYERDDY